MVQMVILNFDIFHKSPWYEVRGTKQAQALGWSGARAILSFHKSQSIYEVGRVACTTSKTLHNLYNSLFKSR
jgi:hypothetical protein